MKQSVNDTTKKKTESETIKQLLNLIDDAQYYLSMIESIRTHGIDTAEDMIKEEDYECAFFNLGNVVYYNKLEDDLKAIRKIIEENTIVRLGGASFKVNSWSTGKERSPEELN